jgi:citrate lyase subunit beta/citryl-CoA lyase
VAWAQRVVDAFKAAEAAQSAAIQLDGQFIDYPIVHQAQRVLAADASIRRNTPKL